LECENRKSLAEIITVILLPLPKPLPRGGV
jgi:hypothetical protein